MMQLKLVHTNFLVSTPFSSVILTLLSVLKSRGEDYGALSSSLDEVCCC